MRTTLLWLLALLITIGISAGIASSLSYRLGKWHGFVAATENAAAAEPANWEQWQYPNVSHRFSSSTGGGGHMGGIVIRPQNCLVVATLDDFEKVAAWYAEKIGPQESHMNFSGSGTETGLHATFRNCQHLDDSQQPFDGNRTQPRPVQLKTFALQTGDFALTVTLSRAKGEKETHIVLVQQ